MTKFRKSLLIFGMLALILSVALATFVVLSLTGSIKSEPIYLEFTVDDQIPREYNGEELKASSYSLTDGRLVEGHTPVITFTGGQTDAGYSFGGMDVKIVDDKGYDVSGEYKIKVNSGLITVLPCNIKIQLNSRTVIYDGKNLDIGNNYTVTVGSLAKGHRVSLGIKDEWYSKAGKSVAGNSLDFSSDVDVVILDSNGRNVTANYSFPPLAGRVDIMKRPLVISPVSAEKTYDGRPLECTQYKIESGSLAEGHYIIPKFQAKADGTLAKITDAETLEIEAKAIVYDVNGDEVTDNYDIKSYVGTLTVNRAALSITAQSGSWVYDGEEHSVSSPDPYQVTGLAVGEKVTVEYDATVREVSKTANKIVGYNVTDTETSAAKEKNYEITLIDGTLEVTKAPLTVTLKPLEKQYDGKPFTKSADEIYTTDAEGVTLGFEAGYVEGLFSDITELGNYTYTFSEFKVLKGGSDVTGNYSVTVLSGNAKITRMKVNLNVGGTLEKSYDGNFTFPASNRVTFSKQLAEGHSIESVTCAPVSAQAARAGAQTDLISIAVTDAQGNSALGYYSIENFSSFKVTVKIIPHSLDVSTPTLKKVYDGTPLKGGEALCGALVSSDRIETLKEVEITDCEADVSNTPEFKIRSMDGKDVTDFYDINSDFGTLTVTPRSVDVYLAPTEIEYEINLNGISLINRLRCDTAKSEYFTIINDAFTKLGENSVRFGWVYDGDEFTAPDGFDVNEYKNFKKNHTIITSNDKFTVVKKKIQAQLSGERDYNAKGIDEEQLVGCIEERVYDTEYAVVSSQILGREDVGTHIGETVYEGEKSVIYARVSYKINAVTLAVSGNENFVKVYDGTQFTPSCDRLRVNGSIDGRQIAVKSCEMAEAVDAKTYENLQFRSVTFMFADTGAEIKTGNVKVSANSSVHLTVGLRELTITLSPVNGNVTSENLPFLSGIINVYNLASGDTVSFGETPVVVNGSITILSMDKVFITRDGVDVRGNYSLPDQVIGTVIN